MISNFSGWLRILSTGSTVPVAVLPDVLLGGPGLACAMIPHRYQTLWPRVRFMVADVQLRRTDKIVPRKFPVDMEGWLWHQRARGVTEPTLFS